MVQNLLSGSVVCEHAEKTTGSITRLAFDENGKIAGVNFNFTPINLDQGADDAPPAAEKSLEERIEDAKAAAEEFVNYLSEDNSEDAWLMMGDALRQSVPEKDLYDAWYSSVIQNCGELTSIFEVSIDEKERLGMVTGTVTSLHENENIASVTQLAFNGAGEIADLFFAYADTAGLDIEKEPVSLTESEFFTEEAIIVGEGGEYPLEGLLTVPKNTGGPVPAVVLVHGSGASDKDETIQGNKIFKDIAHYLSENGIAVIRYDKRSYTYPMKLTQQFKGKMTVYEETIEDAILAKDIFDKDDRFDHEKTFVLGHSLGGCLAPEIAAEGEFDGCIMMAASSRNLIDLILVQYEYLIGLADLSDEEKEAQLKPIKDAVDMYYTYEDSSDEILQSTAILNISAYYYKNLDERLNAGFFDKLEMPVLVMQGDKDYQASADIDFADYMARAEGKDNYTFIEYEGLYHLFMQSQTSEEGKLGTNEDYLVESHVEPQVLRDLAEFILKAEAPLQ